MFKKSKAMTLAEALLTLGIIGVVAALTIPNMIATFRQQQYVTQLKEFYSAFQSGIKLFIEFESCRDLRCTGIFQGEGNAIKTPLLNTFNRMFREVKVYNVGDPKLVNNTYRGLTTSSYNTIFNDSNYPTYRINNSIIKITDSDTGNCELYISDSGTSRIKGACALMTIDVNGFQAPNIIGRDVFNFIIANDGNLYPEGGYESAKLDTLSHWTDSSTNCGEKDNHTIPSDTEGVQCAARIIEGGWEMDY
jgi:type II secretory pathway pseudopilin PulG